VGGVERVYDDESGVGVSDPPAQVVQALVGVDGYLLVGDVEVGFADAVDDGRHDGGALLGGLFEGEPEDSASDCLHCRERAAFGDGEGDRAGEGGFAGLGVACEDDAVAEW
jgi:hypothetical protein